MLRNMAWTSHVPIRRALPNDLDDTHFQLAVRQFYHTCNHESTTHDFSVGRALPGNIINVHRMEQAVKLMVGMPDNTTGLSMKAVALSQ